MSGFFGYPYAVSGRIKVPREWPPSFPILGGLLAPREYADESYRRLAELTRDQWTGDDWKVYALFLEERGKWLLADLQTADKEVGELRSRVKLPGKRGRPKKHPSPPSLRGGLLYGAWGAKPRGRPRNIELEEALPLLIERIEMAREELQAEFGERRVTDKAAIERVIDDYAKANRLSAIRLKKANVARLQKYLSLARRKFRKNPQ